MRSFDPYFQTASQRRLPRAFWSSVILLALSCNALLLLLGHVPLLDNNEGMYASIAAQMLESRDWVIPHLNGVSYLEKPPLLYWLTALSLQCFGDAPWAARLPSALAGMGCVLAVGAWVSRRQSPEQGLLSGALLSSMAGYVVLNRTLIFDPLLMLWMTLALMLAWDARPGRPSTAILAMLCLALAVLTKGLLAPVLFGGILLAACLWTRNPLPLRALCRPLPLLTFIGTTAPWHLWAAQRDPDFLWFYFVNEHWLRFLGERIPRDYYNGPWWYYLPRLLLLTLPWFPLLLLRLRQPWPEWARLAFCACLLPLLFFSVSRAKANYYILLILPWIAILAGHLLHTRLEYLSRFWKYWHLMVLLLGLGVLWGGLCRIPEQRPLQMAVALTLLMLVVAGAACLLTSRHRWLATAQLAILIPLGGISLADHPHWHASSQPDIAILRGRHSEAELLLFGKLESASALAFSQRQPWPLVESSSDDLYFGQQRGERQDLFLDANTAQHRLDQGALLVVPEHALKRFHQSPLALQLHLVDESGSLQLYALHEAPDAP